MYSDSYLNFLCFFMMKFLLFLAFFVFSSPSYSGTLPPYKYIYGIVDFDHVMNSSESMIKLNEKFQSEKEALKSKIISSNQDLEKMDKDLSSQKAILSEEAFNQKYLEFNHLVESSREEYKQSIMSIEQRYSDSFAYLSSKIKDVVKGQAELLGLKMVFSSGAVVFFSQDESNGQAIDISDYVLKELNSQVSEIDSFDKKHDQIIDYEGKRRIRESR